MQMQPQVMIRLLLLHTGNFSERERKETEKNEIFQLPWHLESLYKHCSNFRALTTSVESDGWQSNPIPLPDHSHAMLCQNYLQITILGSWSAILLCFHLSYNQIQLYSEICSRKQNTLLHGEERVFQSGFNSQKTGIYAFYVCASADLMQKETCPNLGTFFSFLKKVEYKSLRKKKSNEYL